MLWEDLEVVEEEFVPMYCELEAHGFKAAADSILLTHGGMRTIAGKSGKICTGVWRTAKYVLVY